MASPTVWNLRQLAICLCLLLTLFEIKATDFPIDPIDFDLELELVARNITEQTKDFTVETGAKNTSANNNVIQIALLNHNLVPGDLITIYDGNFSHIVKQYSYSSATPSLSVTSTLPLIHIFFTATASDSKSVRNFTVLVRRVPKGVCNPIFSGQSGTVISRKHPGFDSCRYIIRLPQYDYRNIFLWFHDLKIPRAEKLVIWEGNIDLKPEKKFLELTHSDSGQELQFVSPSARGVILEFDSSTSFNVSFRQSSGAFLRKKKLVIPVSGESGEFTLRKLPKQLIPTIWYLISVPKGRAFIRLQDLHLPTFSEKLEITGFNGTNHQLLRVYDSSSKPHPLSLTSINNFLMVKFSSSKDDGSSFKLAYSAVETAPRPCSKPSLSFVKKLETISYEGWQQSVSCKSGYVNKYGRKEVTATCLSNGSWTYEEKMLCLRQCPPIASLYNLTGRGLWSLDLNSKHLSGDTVTFFCDDIINDSIHGNKKITCTSSGKYSSEPPYCKKGEELNTWWITLVSVLAGLVPVMFGTIVFIIVLFRYHQRRKNELGQNAVVSVPHENYQLQGITAMDNPTQPSTGPDPLQAEPLTPKQC